MKKTIKIYAFSILLPLSGAQAAANGNVNFEGMVVNQTCNATINGDSSGTFVTLPKVQTSLLSKPGETAGQTSFNIEVANCLATNPSNSGMIKAFFEKYNTKGYNLDSEGRLTSLAANSAKNVVLELVDGTSNTPISVGSQNQITSDYVNISSGNAKIPYAVRYYATGQSTPGYLSGEVRYVLIYK